MPLASNDPGGALDISGLLALISGQGQQSLTASGMPFRSTADQFALEDISRGLSETSTPEEIAAVRQKERDYIVSKEREYKTQDAAQKSWDDRTRLLSSLLQGSLTTAGTPGSFGQALSAGATRAFEANEALTKAAQVEERNKTLAEEYASQQRNRMIQQGFGAAKIGQRQATMQETAEWHDRVAAHQAAGLSIQQARLEAYKELGGRNAAAREWANTIAQQRADTGDVNAETRKQALEARYRVNVDDAMTEVGADLNSPNPELRAAAQTAMAELQRAKATGKPNTSIQRIAAYRTAREKALGRGAGGGTYRSARASLGARPPEPEMAAAWDALNNTIQDLESSGVPPGKETMQAIQKYQQGVLSIRGRKDVKQTIGADSGKKTGTASDLDLRQTIASFADVPTSQQYNTDSTIRNAYDALVNYYNQGGRSWPAIRVLQGKLQAAVKYATLRPALSTPAQPAPTLVPEPEATPEPAIAAPAEAIGSTPIPTPMPGPTGTPLPVETPGPVLTPTPGPTGTPMPAGPEGGAPSEAATPVPGLIEPSSIEMFKKLPKANQAATVKEAYDKGFDAVARQLEAVMQGQ
jgi:hypothetical protein